MAVKKSVRFEVFKRDKFTCQYCGRSAPDVVLHADHIHPVSEGGEDDILNLVTSCQDCNLGKSNRILSDDAVIKQRKSQLDVLQERHEQLEMLLEWHKSLVDIEDVTVQQVADFWARLVSPYRLTDIGLTTLRKLLKRYSVDEVVTAMNTSVAQYVGHKQQDGAVSPTVQSVGHAWEMVGPICAANRRNKDKPWMQKLYYARGILRNRFNWSDPRNRESLAIMEDLIDLGADVDAIIDFAKSVYSWGDFLKEANEWKQALSQ